MPVTTDFAGTETLAETKSRLGTLLTAYGYDSSGYSTWGDARTDLNSALTAIEETTISDGELASSFRSKLNALNAWSDYPAGGKVPNLVFDFEDEFYRSNDSETAFDDSITHSATTNATMVDSDGVLKWRPHNLALNSASPATQSITVISGADYTVECTGVSIALSGAGSGTVTEGNPIEITASTTTLTLTVTGSTGTMWVYRSDLGGMVNNPDTGNSYVPTTSAARYLPRRGHHVWNGSAWVNEGLLHESEARTNLVPYSEDFAYVDWVRNALPLGTGVTSPDGTTSSTKLIPSAALSDHYIQYALTPATGTFTDSIFAKAGELKNLLIRPVHIGADQGTTQQATFDLSTGTTSNVSANCTAKIQDFGNGWYRCSFTYTVSGTITGTYAFRAQVNDNSNVAVYSGDDTSGLYVFGAQREEGSTPSSYIPNYGAPSGAHRAAETLTIPAAKLPWPTPNVIGPELVTNGTFDTDTTGWTAIGGSISWVSGSLRLTEDGSDGVSARAYQSITTEVGRVYRITVDVGAVSDGSAIIAASDNTNFGGKPQITASANTSAELIFVAVATSTNVLLTASGTSARTLDFDNISVREIDPLSVSIQMDGRVTYADTDQATEVRQFNWNAGSGNYISHYLQTNGARTGLLRAAQSYNGTFDSSASPETYLAPGVLVSYNFSSRHGSTFVQAAEDGTLFSADIDPTALPDLSTTDLSLGNIYMGTIRTLRMWNQDITDAGIEEASA